MTEELKEGEAPKNTEPELDRSDGNLASAWHSLAFMVFLIALGTRLLAFYFQGLHPEGLLPFADSANFFRRAQQLVSGGGFDDDFFWQSLGYTLYLTTVFGIFGIQIKVALFLQCLFSSITAALTCLTAEIVGGPTLGLLAGLGVAFYGPLIAYDLQLLSEGLAAFITMLSLYLLLKPLSNKGSSRFFLLGILVGLAALFRVNLAPPLMIGALWILHSLWRSASVTSLSKVVGWYCLAFALVTLPVATITRVHTGKFTILPQSGGCDIFQGNHPNLEYWLSVRTYEYDKFHRLPALQGIFKPWEQNRFLYQKAWENLLENPVFSLKNLIKKAIQFYSPREIPASEDVYAFTAANPFLTLLVSKCEFFGFPFGVPFGLVFPLLFIGLTTRWRGIPFPLHALVILYPLSIIVFHCSGRYRLPLMPVLLIIAAMGCLEIVERLRTRQLRVLAVPVLIALILSGITIGYSSSPREKTNFAAEQDFLRGKWLYERLKEKKNASAKALADDLQSVKFLYERAIQKNPQLAAAYCALGLFYHEGLPNPHLALQNLNQAITLDPQSYTAFGARGLFMLKSGKFPEACQDFDAAIRLYPGDPKGYDGRGWARLEGMNDQEAALKDFNQALTLDPKFTSALNNRGQIWLRQKNWPEAIKDFSQAISLDSRFFQALNSRGSAFFQSGDLDAALRDYNAAIILAPEYKNALYNRAMLHLQRKSPIEARIDLRKFQELGGVLEPELQSFLNQTNLPAR